MNDSEEFIKHSIESSECILHKKCEQLRELIFMDDYDPDVIMGIVKNIKFTSDIIIAQLNKLKSIHTGK